MFDHDIDEGSLYMCETLNVRSQPYMGVDAASALPQEIMCCTVYVRCHNKCAAKMNII